MNQFEFSEEQIDEYRKFRIRNNSYETLWTREERYLMNLQRTKHLEYLEKKMEKKDEPV